MRKLTFVFFVTTLMLLFTGTVFAHHIEGQVYCDANSSGLIDEGDLPLEGVCVNVVSTDSGTVDSTDCTDIDGYYYIGLPSIRPASYNAALVSGLPADASFVDPSTNLHSFVIEDGHINEFFDWLIDSAVCHECGDGSVDPGETCDPQAPDAPENCRADCTYCGDSVLDSGEECDDGNNLDGDGCSAECDSEETGSEGCTPGYWKNHTGLKHQANMWPPTNYEQDDDFDSTFGVALFNPDITLLEALNAKGGGDNKLARHGTAALLSAAHPDVDYPLTVVEVIALVQAGDADTLAEANELGCPL